MEPMYKTLREIEKLNPNNPEKEKKLNPKYKMRDVDIIGPEDIKQYQNYKPKNYNIPYKTEPDVEYPPRNDYYNVGPTGKVEESSESSKKPSVTENKESEPEIESEPKPKPETKKKIDKDKKHKNKKEPVEKHETSKKEPTKIIPPQKKHKQTQPTQPTQPSTNPNDIKPIQKRESVFGKENDININEPEKPARPKINKPQVEDKEEKPQKEPIKQESEPEEPEIYDSGIIPGIGKKKIEPADGEEIVFSGVVGGNTEKPSKQVSSYHDESEGHNKHDNRINTITYDTKKT
jgi:hypothetical protein